MYDFDPLGNFFQDSFFFSATAGAGCLEGGGCSSVESVTVEATLGESTPTRLGSRIYRIEYEGDRDFQYVKVDGEIKYFDGESFIAKSPLSLISRP